MVHSDGTRASYFSYNNVSDSDLTIVTDTVADTINELTPEEEALTPPTLFKPGLVRGEIAFTHRSESLTWTVKAAGAEQSSATSSPLTRACQPLKPVAACQQGSINNRSVVIGYENPNPFSIRLPIGPLNSLSSGVSTTNQPTEFLPGLNPGVATVVLLDTSDPKTWTLNGTTISLDETLQSCDVGCVNLNSADIIKKLDNVALQLSRIAQRTSQTLLKARRAAKVSQGNTRSNTPKVLPKDRRYVQRSIRRAKDLEQQAYRLTINVPAVTKSCPTAPQYCETLDRWGTIGALRGLYARLVDMTKRQTARFYFLELGQTKANRTLVVKAKKLQKIGNSELDKLPRLATECA
jgi:hypothetical protein